MQQNPLVFAPVKDILVIQLGDIGDVVLTLPCIRALKETYPDARVHAAVWDKASEIVADCRWVDGVIPVRRTRGAVIARLLQQAAFLRDIRKRRIDLAIDFRTGTRGAVLAGLSGARWRIGFLARDDPFWRNPMFTHLAAPAQAPGDHMVDFHLSLLSTYDIRTPHRWPEMTPPPQRVDAVDALLRHAGVPPDRRLVVLQPFSLWRYKEWAQERYAELVRRTVRDHGVVVVVTGGPGERDRAADLAADCGEDVFNLAERTSIGEYAALLARADLFIGVDSAGMHLAAAVGTPTVLIFGPSSDADWAPRGTIHRVVRAGWDCEPCFDKGCANSGRSRCLEALDVASVADAVQASLGAFHRTRTQN